MVKKLFEIPRGRIERMEFLRDHGFPVSEAHVLHGSNVAEVMEKTKHLLRSWPIVFVNPRNPASKMRRFTVSKGNANESFLTDRLPKDEQVLLVPMAKKESTGKGIISFTRDGETLMDLVGFADYPLLSKGRATPSHSFSRKIGGARFEVKENTVGKEPVIKADVTTGRQALIEMKRLGLLDKMQEISGRNPEKAVWFEFTVDPKQGLKFFEVDWR